jgi:hypothetical protein
VKLMALLKFARLLRMLGLLFEGGTISALRGGSIGPSCSLVATDRLKRCPRKAEVLSSNLAKSSIFQWLSDTPWDGVRSALALSYPTHIFHIDLIVISTILSK